CIFDHQDILFELRSEPLRVTFIIDSLVETAGELRSDGLHRDFQVSQGFQDEQQVNGFLWLVYFVHRYLGNERPFSLDGCNMAVDGCSLINGKQEFPGEFPQIALSHDDPAPDTWYPEFPDERAMSFNEALDIGV